MIPVWVSSRQQELLFFCNSYQDNIEDIPYFIPLTASLHIGHCYIRNLHLFISSPTESFGSALVFVSSASIEKSRRGQTGGDGESSRRVPNGSADEVYLINHCKHGITLCLHRLLTYSAHFPKLRPHSCAFPP